MTCPSSLSPSSGANSKFLNEYLFPFDYLLIPEVGLEPTRPCGQRILNPSRLAIPPLRLVYGRLRHGSLIFQQRSPCRSGTSARVFFMDIYVFEDSKVLALGPLIAARPACDITIGISTLHEMLSELGNGQATFATTPAAIYRRACRYTRTPHWECYADSKYTFQNHSDHVLFVNARLVPNRSSLVALQNLVGCKPPWENIRRHYNSCRTP